MQKCRRNGIQQEFDLRLHRHSFWSVCFRLFHKRHDQPQSQAWAALVPKIQKAKAPEHQLSGSAAACASSENCSGVRLECSRRRQEAYR